ncbi:MAG: nitroreductase family protein [Paludibacteraceae bacterium]|nr:nitroreductase family protein [Paludibacteraceae bacterium]
MENFEQLCQVRRSVRKYQHLPVEQEKLDYILRCALMSPSGKRVNPWEFYVVKNEDMIRKMAACRDFGSGMFNTAMAAIVVALDASLTDVWMPDGAIAAQNILLAATEQGLGACWCHIYGRYSEHKEEGRETVERVSAEQYIKNLVGIPENMSVLCVISLGYKDEERKPYDFEKLLYNKIHTIE